MSDDTPTTSCSATCYNLTVYIPATCTGSTYVTVAFAPPPPRRIFVTAPKKWGKKKLLGFARLVNHDTNTGWVVESICLGEVIITDPNVERRTMDEFVELLKWRASKADQDTIDKFMASK